MEMGEVDVCLRLGLRSPQAASAQGPLTHLAWREGGHFGGTVYGKARESLVAASPKLSRVPGCRPWGSRATSSQAGQAWPVRMVFWQNGPLRWLS